MHEFLLVGATFLACLVEMVEALTIVLAVGATRGWRSAMYGTCAAATLLAAFVVALGPRLAALPIGSLRLAIGGLLLDFETMPKTGSAAGVGLVVVEPRAKIEQG